MYTGKSQYNKQVHEIDEILADQEEELEKVASWMENENKGPEGNAYIDVTTPLWAIWHTPSWIVKKPSPMMVYSIGQTESFGYYKKVTEWSTIYDNDLVQELSNPEKLTSSTLDFGFVVIYLAPLLMIILLYNIKGYEQDSNMLGLLRVQLHSIGQWLVGRILYYYLMVMGGIFFSMAIFGIITTVLPSNAMDFMAYFITVAVYLLIWTILLSLVLVLNTGSTLKAVIMSAIWLVLTILIPGSVHQSMAIAYPSSYMTAFLDAKRNGTNELYGLYGLSQDSLREVMLDPKLELHGTASARDSLIGEDLISNALPYLANLKTRNAAADIEQENYARNRYIRSRYFFNPVTFFQNRLNAICQTDYYAYRAFRDRIQEVIDRRSATRAMDVWNKIEVDKERLNFYNTHFNLLDKRVDDEEL
ncbi:hypothetical protein GCM10011339_36250 [Echinicola rosea]|uniref:DUF3526 domain-containing protein n=2 Tax=Echinicola rosea TaxID=1807691 RepID=A0ABQ1V9X7_9BACT|nr:hypothetical protein GCM10011339_36250 [Echinicola rosea]